MLDLDSEGCSPRGPPAGGLFLDYISPFYLNKNSCQPPFKDYPATQPPLLAFSHLRRAPLRASGSLLQNPRF